jgi:hypothetical protein
MGISNFAESDWDYTFFKTPPSRLPRLILTHESSLIAPNGALYA